MKFSYYLWLLYLIVFPFYVFSEGNPQIADALGTLLIIINLRSILMHMTAHKFTKFFFYFVVYSFLVNTIWMLIIGDLIVLRTSLYYLYCFFFLVYVFTNLKDKAFLKTTLLAIFISLSLQFVLWPFIEDQGVRTQLYFNNPNQLALWALCLLIIVNGINLIQQQKLYLILVISALCTFFIFLSASRSAVVCSILFWLFFYVKSKKNIIAISIIVLLFFIYVISNGNIKIENMSWLNYIAERLEGDQVLSNSGLAGRGYNRLIEFPQYMLFGAGEGFEGRFNSNMELHSTFLGIIFSYGLIGFYFAGKAMIMIITKSYREIIVLFLILSIFGNVHMILRIPLFWVCLTVLLYAKIHKRDSEALKTNQSILIP